MLRHLIVAAVVCAGSSVAVAETTVRIGVATPALQFDFLYGDYGVDRTRINSGASCIGEPDLVVALQLSRTTGFDLDVIVGWRRDGQSWDVITRRCRRDATIYYIEVPAEVSGPPYGRAHGYWKKHPKGDLHLTDAEIREFAMVQAVAGHCRLAPEEVVRRRAGGESPQRIASSRGHREDTAPVAPAPAASKSGQARGAAADHGKGASKHKK